MRTRIPNCCLVHPTVFAIAAAVLPAVAWAADPQANDTLKTEIERLEKASGLDEDQIEVLRELRAEPVKRNDSYQMSREFQEVFRIEELTDEALALIVYSLQTQIPPSGERQHQEGFDTYRLADLFRGALDHAHAGPATNRAFSRWIRERIIPTMAPSEEPGGPSLDHQMIEIVKRLLLRDALDAETFDAFMQAFCGKLESGADRGYGQIGAEPPVMVSLCYSKHMTSGHLGRIGQALMLSMSRSDGRSGYGGSSDVLKFIVASPHLTADQARALLTWVLDHEPRGYYDHGWYELVTQLTTPFELPDELVRIDPIELYKPTGSRQLRQKWREWWVGHRDQPWPGRKGDRRLRCILATIGVVNNKAIAVRIVADTPIEIGRGYFFTVPGTGAEASWISLTKMSAGPLWDAMLPRGWVPKTAVLAQDYHFSGSGWGGGGGSVYVPGAVHFTGRSSHQSQDRSVTSIRGVHLCDLSAGPGPSTKQVNDLSYWMEGAVTSAADQVRRMATDPQLADLNLPISGLGTTVLQLESYRLAGMEEPITRLLDDRNPAVAAAAALVLARWQAEFDTEKLPPMLKSEPEPPDVYCVLA